MIILVRIQGDYPFSTYAKFSEKLTLPADKHTYVYISGGKKD